MTSVRSWAALASVGLAVSAAAVTTGSPASAAPSSGRAALAGSLTTGAERSRPEGRVAAGASVSFDLNLSLRNAAGAQALLKAISTPGSAQYRHYLTQAQWIARFAPTAATVSSAKTWLRQQGFSVGVVPADRLFIPATGTAAQVERAFNTTLGTFKVNGKDLRLANSALSIPSAICRPRLRCGGRQSVDRDQRSQRGIGVGCLPEGRKCHPGAPATGRLQEPAAMLVVLRSEDRHDR